LFVELQVGMGDTAEAGTAARDYTNGLVGRCPIPRLDEKLARRLGELGERCIAHHRRLTLGDELSPEFVGFFFQTPNIGQLDKLADCLWNIRRELLLEILESHAEADEIVEAAFCFNVEEQIFLESVVGPHPMAYPLERSDERTTPLPARLYTKKCYIADQEIEARSHADSLHPRSVISLPDITARQVTRARSQAAADIISGLMGIVLGRWPVGIFFNRGDDRCQEVIHWDWRISTHASSSQSGAEILVSDRGHDSDMGEHLNRAGRAVFSADWENLCEELARELGGNGGTLVTLVLKRGFKMHVERYSAHKRSAPIYWELTISSHTYAVWLYYHRLTKDTFYKLFNDYVKPKHEHEQRKLDRLRAEAGPEPTRSQRGEIDQQETFVAELKTFAEEIDRITPLWNPDLNDGVIINFAPLWRLVPQHKAWQKECKACWDKLVKGDYDWAKLAMHLWPERVVPKCRTDASLAIAHVLEDMFWEQDAKDKWVSKDEPEEGWESTINKLVTERTSPAVKAALDSLLNAPALGIGKKTRKKTGKRRARAR